MANQADVCGIDTISLNEDLDDVPSPPEHRRQKLRSDEELLFNVQFPHYSLGCRTNGKETVIDMVRRSVRELRPNSRPKFQFMLFKGDSDDEDSYINLGLPSGMLQKEVNYKCIFKEKLEYKTTDLFREYSVTEFSDNWGLKHVYLKLDVEAMPKIPNVTPLQRIISKGLLKVHFFPGETLYEALHRDGRICQLEGKSCSKSIIRKCKLLCEKHHVSIAAKADSLEGKIIQMCLGRKEDESLPLMVPALTKPKAHLDAEESQAEKTADQAERVTPMMPRNKRLLQPITSTPDSIETTSAKDKSEPAISLSSGDDLQNYIEKFLHVNTKRQENRSEERARCKKIKELFKSCHYDNFALKQIHGSDAYISNRRRMNKVSESVGAMIIENKMGNPEIKGTCFRIGTKYVITSNHVAQLFSAAIWSISPDAMYVDFSFEEGKSPAGKKYFFAKPLTLAHSEELDYAILNMKSDPQKPLPPDICCHGQFVIPPPGSRDVFKDQGLALTLIGHPDGQPKKIDPICPIGPAHLGTLSKTVMLALRQVDDTYDNSRHDVRDGTRMNYHVSEFFHGSSGSPGLLADLNLLMTLHCRGFFLEDAERSAIEQGVLMSEIVEDIRVKIGHRELDVALEEVFPAVGKAERAYGY